MKSTYSLPSILFILSTLINQTQLSAQEIKLESIPSKNTLSSNSVYALLRDSEGFLWIGTQNGLNRYDGEDFTLFLSNAEDTTTLSDNFIVSLAEDSAGNIWIGTRHGLNKFNKRTQTFERFYLISTDINPLHQTVMNIVCNSDGNIFAVSGGNYFIISRDTPHRISSNSLSDSVFSIFRDGENIFLGKLGQVEMVSSSGKNRSFQYAVKLFPAVVRIFAQTLYVGTEDGLFIFDLDQNHQTQSVVSLLKKQNITAIEKDLLDRIWIGTDNGIYLLNNGKILIHLKEDQSSETGLHSSSVRSLKSDAFGLMWVGMARGGVQKYDPLKERFVTIDKNVMNNSIVWSTAQNDTNYIIAGTQNGLFQIDLRNGSKNSTRSLFPQIFFDKMVRALELDKNGNLWIAAGGNILFKNSLKKNMIERFPLNHLVVEKRPVSITDILKDETGMLWIATTNGLFIFNEQQKIFKKVNILDTIRSRENFYFMHLLKDSEGILWISSSHGLYAYDVRSRLIEKFNYSPNDSLTLSFNIVASCMEDSKKRFWVATLGGGFNQYNRKTKTFTRYTSDDGLINNVVYGMLEDSHGRLWMSTDNGIVCFDPDNNKFRSFGKEEGLEFLEFSQNAFYKNSAGKMFFGGIGGLLLFQPERFGTVKRSEPMIATDIRVNYQSIQPNDPIITEGTINNPIEIQLTPEQKTLSLDFVLLDFRSQRKTNYSYRLEGFYDEWVYPTHQQRTAHYTHLPSGTYYFEARSSTQKSEWDGKSLRLRIIVHPSFWETWWFISITSILAIGLFASTIRYVSQRKLKEQLREIEIQHQIQSERERISRELHDSAGANLAGLISGLDMAEKYVTTSSQKTKRTLRSLTNDARISMAQLRETIWAMKSNELSLEQFHVAIKENLARQLKYSKQIHYSVTAAGNISFVLSPIQVLNLFRIIQEAVTNILKHAHAKNITVEISSDEKNIEITIENDGAVKSKQEQSLLHGQGILNMERRAKELGGTMSVTVGQENGCCVIVIVPKKKMM